MSQSPLFKPALECLLDLDQAVRYEAHELLYIIAEYATRPNYIRLQENNVFWYIKENLERFTLDNPFKLLQIMDFICNKAIDNEWTPDIQSLYQPIEDLGLFDIVSELIQSPSEKVSELAQTLFQNEMYYEDKENLLEPTTHFNIAS